MSNSRSDSTASKQDQPVIWCREKRLKSEKLELKPLFRKELIINIPIKSDSIREFKANYYSGHTANILNFVKETLFNNFKIKMNKNFDLSFIDILQNAYDSYAQAGLVAGNEFIFKVVIKEKDQKVILKFMDNGGGFDNHPKRSYFKRTDVKFKNKSLDMFGGIRLGLEFLEIDVLKSNASLFFKNRKHGGATVSIQFNEKQALEADSTKETLKLKPT